MIGYIILGGALLGAVAFAVSKTDNDPKNGKKYDPWTDDPYTG